MWEKLAPLKVQELFVLYPYASDFFVGLPDMEAYSQHTVETYFAELSEDILEDIGMEKTELIKQFIVFLTQMEQLKDVKEPIDSITIIGGRSKSGQRENFDLTIHVGEIICIVGQTGSGKSRLLADIEWLAQKDTPTERQILLNGKVPDLKKRFSIEHKLVAQLSQNMNFIMDLTAEEFVTMHAESRMLDHIPDITAKILAKANELAGEEFLPETPVTSLSGGQSRSLMIADTAYLSSSPIVLIDEIENAGIDRQKALQLLTDSQKIVLMATHDPILALSGDKRLVIKNGGIHRILETTAKERENLGELAKLDQRLSTIRDLVRAGERIETLPVE